MDDTKPSVTVVIAARPEQMEIKAVTAARKLDYAQVEILVARGKQPSAQRNAAIRSARGELIYFLDDDSVPDAANLERAMPHFRDPTVKMVGGPNLCPPDAPPLEQVFGLVLSSAVAFGPSRARYAAIGTTRESSEKELILCNLIARRDALLELGGFNEALYPNEENALMDELQKRGGKLIYCPEMIVLRRPRSNLRAFARMLMTYGRGRAEQFRVNPTAGSVLNFAPPLLCIYFILAALAWLFTGFSRVLILLPLAAYVVVVLAQAAAHIGRGGVFRSIATIPLIVLTHLLYGYGFWRGLFTPLRKPGEKPPGQVVLESV